MREKITHTIKQTSITLGQNEIQAVRRKVSKRTGCRIYKDGIIGIAGAIGQADENELYAKAEKNLGYKISYPVEQTANKQKTTDIQICKTTDKELFSDIEQILAYVAEKHPNFGVNHKANLNEFELTFENDLNTKLIHRDKLASLMLLLKKKGSLDILDTMFEYTGREVNVEKACSAITEIITAFETQVEMPKETLPIIIDGDELTSIFQRDLNGKRFGTGASLFLEQIGKTVFNPNFNLKILTDPIESYSPVFDMEGTIPEEEYTWLIKEGKILRPFTDKRTAQKYNYDNTGCAGGSYDGVPTLGGADADIIPSKQTLKELLNGQKGILVTMAGGGDFTPDGIFASPVQLAYLTDGEKLLGKLPQFTIKASVYDIFGKGFVGVSSDKIYTVGNKHLLVTNMEVATL